MYTIRARLSDNIDARQKRSFSDITTSGLNVPLDTEDWQKRWCSMPTNEDNFKRLYEFQVKDDDVYVVTFPKCGTTWIQEATWLLVNNLDFQKANQLHLEVRSIYMDLSALFPELPKDTIELARQSAEPRVIKTHLPAHLLPKQIWEKKSKIIYCARNPKDMAVSFFYFHRGLGTWQGDINEFVEDLINNDIMYTPYWEHLMDFWRMRYEKNVFFTTFEDMKRNLREVLISLNGFLEKPQLTEEQLKQLVEHLSFENMRANQHINPTQNMKSRLPDARADFQFMRRGIVGSHKDELMPETQKKLDFWIQENLRKFDIKLKDIFGII